LEKESELYIAVALYAGVWGNAAFVSVNEYVYDITFECVLEIKYVKGYAEFVSYLAGTGKAFQRAAFILRELFNVLSAVYSRIGPKAKMDPHHIIPLLF
jgi:hypothetical protein